MNSLKNKKLFLLDMDGTIYLDNRLFPHCLDFLRHIKAIGGAYVFLTNNSSNSVSKYVKKLQALGISSEKRDFLTSTQATVLYLKKNYPNKKMYAFGTASFKEELLMGGINIADSLDANIEGLVMGFDTELSFKKLEDACILLNRNVFYIATNPDLVCPTYYGYVPDCGSIAEILYNATKRHPVVIGKPQPEMALLAMQNKGFSKEETILIGDRIYTDIACGVNAGISTALVLSGETKLSDIEKSECKPEFVFEDIAEILSALQE